MGTGWRVPTKAELESIIDYTAPSPAINVTAFPGTPANWFWASSPFVGSSNIAWSVNYYDGDSNGSNISQAYNVRCVRSSRAVFASSGSSGAPPGRYTINSGTVKDTRTGLTWQQSVDAGSYTGANAKTYCGGLSLAGTGWRLPTISELLTLVDPTKYSPAIDPTAFPATPTDWFWSSSPYVGSSGTAWLVYFYGYSSYTDTNSSTYHVRCVR